MEAGGEGWAQASQVWSDQAGHLQEQEEALLGGGLWVSLQYSRGLEQEAFAVGWCLHV